MTADDKAWKIVDAILDDLTDRRGFRQTWDETDDDVQAEIRKAWQTIAFELIAGV